MATRNNRKKWDKESMIAAVKAVRNKEMGYEKAHKQFNVPKTTLRDYVNNRDQTPEELVNVKLGRKAVLPEEMEADLVNYCLEMDKRFYGLTSSDIRRMTFQLAIRNGLPHPFSCQKGSAGKKWLRTFFRRHPNLAFRKPQGISSARVKGFTQENVTKFFDILEPAMQKINNNASRVYNVDETGITNVQSKHSKVISLKGKRQVGAITAAERGSLVTVVTSMNAAGGFVPPMSVFPRKNMKLELLDGAPPGTISGCHPSGWIQQHLVTQWFHHFIKHVKPSADDPVLLILDGHYSHTRNLEIIELARQHSVIIVLYSLPPHSTHKMQPLDLAFMAPFKTYYSQEIESWLKNHVGRNISAYQIGELFGRAYLKSATAEVSAHGFSKSGIYPCNRYIFHDYDFAIHSKRERTPPRENCNTTLASQKANVSDHNVHIGPQDITPLPSCSSNISNNRKPRKGSANLISGTPYKEELEKSLENISAKKQTVKRKVLSSEEKPSISKSKKAVKKGDLISGKKSDASHVKKAQGKNKKKVENETDSESDVDLVLDDDSDMDCTSDDEGQDDTDTECMFCLGRYSDDTRGEQWIRCLQCYKWGHAQCANSDKK